MRNLEHVQKKSPLSSQTVEVNNLYNLYENISVIPMGLEPMTHTLNHYLSK